MYPSHAHHSARVGSARLYATAALLAATVLAGTADVMRAGRAWPVPEAAQATRVFCQDASLHASLPYGRCIALPVH